MAINESKRGSSGSLRSSAKSALEVPLGPDLELFAAISRSGSELQESPLYPQIGPGKVEWDDYQVALVWPNDTAAGAGSKFEPPALPGPAVLLPLRWKELLAGVRRSIRRSHTEGELDVVGFGDIGVDFVKMEVRRISGEVIRLKRQEFKTLRCFLLNPERVFSRDELLNEAWGYDNYPSTRTVDNHVLRLRQKLEKDPASPVHFVTVHGVGYQFVP
jgi:hypothetical protein